MAVVKMSALVTDIKGKVGGDVYQWTAGGITVRGSKVQAKHSIYQPALQKSIFGTVSAAWRNLTPTQRATWVTTDTRYSVYTKFGVARIPSAYHLFMIQNAQLVAAAQSILPSLAAWSTPTSPAGSSFASTSYTALKLAFSFSILASELLIIESTPAWSPGRGVYQGHWRTIYQAPYPSPPTLIINPYYENHFGLVPLGLKVNFRISILSTTTGIRSARKIISDITT